MRTVSEATFLLVLGNYERETRTIFPGTLSTNDVKVLKMSRLADSSKLTIRGKRHVLRGEL